MGKKGPKKSFSDGKDKRKGRLDEQTIGYYRRISETLREGFETDTDKELFLGNVFKTVESECVKVSQNQTVSGIMETLLKEAGKDHISQVFKSFSGCWELVCTDRFASHVAQTLVLLCSQYMDDNIMTTFTSLVDYLQDNLAANIQDTYTSHIARAVIQVLGGVTVPDDVTRSKISQQFDKGNTKKSSNIPISPSTESMKETLHSMCASVLDFNKLKEFTENPMSCAVLETMVKVVCANDSHQGSVFIQSLMDKTNMFELDPDEGIPSLMAHPVGTRLVEVVLGEMTTSEDKYSDFYDKYVCGKCLNLALHRQGNHVLQRLIERTHNVQQYESIYKEIHKNLEDVLAMNHLRVIQKLADGAVKHGVKQDKLLKDLMKAFHCYKPAERQTKLVPLIASVSTYEVFYKLPEEDNEDDSSDDEDDSEIERPQLKEINFHGSLLLQSLLKFGNPKSIVTSLLDLSAVELRFLACDQSGSFIIDAFLSTPSIGEKSHEKLIRKFKGLYTDLSCNKIGSRVVDNLWKVATLALRMTIADELVKNEHRLNGDRFGKYVWSNCGLQHFKHRKEEWKRMQTNSSKKRKAVEELMGIAPKLSKAPEDSESQVEGFIGNKHNEKRNNKNKDSAGNKTSKHRQFIKTGQPGHHRKFKPRK